MNLLTIALEVFGRCMLIESFLVLGEFFPTLRNHSREIGESDLSMRLPVATLLGAVAEPAVVVMVG
jgi:hypothetical protein